MDARAGRHLKRHACKRGLDAWYLATRVGQALRRHELELARRCKHALELQVLCGWRSFQRLNTKLENRVQKLMGRCESVALEGWRQVAFVLHSLLLPLRACLATYASRVGLGLGAPHGMCMRQVAVEQRVRSDKTRRALLKRLYRSSIAGAPLLNVAVIASVLLALMHLTLD